MKKLFFFLFLATQTQAEYQKAPLFQAPAVTQDGKEISFNLADLAGQKVVLYFYPMDNTPGCTKQAKNFRDNIAKLEAAGITVIGISCDSIKSHIKFQKKHHLPFMLVSDNRWKRSISKAYGAAGFLYSKRHIYVIDENGDIVKTFNNVNIESQVDNIIAVFASHTQK